MNSFIIVVYYLSVMGHFWQSRKTLQKKLYECKILKTLNMHTLYIHNISIVQKLCMYSSCIYFINEQKIPFTQYIKCVNVHLLSGAYIGCLPFQVLPQSSTFHGNRTSKDASIYVLWLESFLNPKLNPQSKCVK